MNIKRNRKRICDFIGWTLSFDDSVTRMLSHIAPHNELTWDENTQKFEEEDLSFAPYINILIDQLSRTPSYDDYHRFMDAELEASKFSKDVIFLDNKRWKSVENCRPLSHEEIGEYLSQNTLSVGSLGNLKKSISSRITAARKAKVKNWDDLDDGHRDILAQLIMVVLYVMSSDPRPNGQYIWETDEDFQAGLRSTG